VSFAAITLCVASERPVLKVSLYIVIDPVRKLLDTPAYKGGVSYTGMMFVSYFVKICRSKVI